MTQLCLVTMTTGSTMCFWKSWWKKAVWEGRSACWRHKTSAAPSQASVGSLAALFRLRHGERLLIICAADASASPRTLGFGSLRIPGVRTAGGLLMYYLVHLLEEENGFFSLSPPNSPALLYIPFSLFCREPSQLLSFQAWPWGQSYSRPVARACRSKGLGRQTDRPHLNQKLGHGSILFRIPVCTHGRLRTKAISSCRIILFSPSWA